MFWKKKGMGYLFQLNLKHQENRKECKHKKRQKENECTTNM
jgi:hypothetical protein